MRAWTIGAMAVLGATGLGAITVGCDEEHDCPAAQLFADLAVTVIVPDGASVDDVTARKGSDEPISCEAQTEPDGGPSFVFDCSTQWAGAYTITVQSGTETRTAVVNVENDDCSNPINAAVTIDFTTPAS